MQTKLVRTTVQLDPKLYKNVKLKMINEQMTFREMVESSLEAVINGQIIPKTIKKSKENVRFGGNNLGGVIGKRSRSEFYKDMQRDTNLHADPEELMTFHLAAANAGMKFNQFVLQVLRRASAPKLTMRDLPFLTKQKRGKKMGLTELDQELYEV